MSSSGDAEFGFNAGNADEPIETARNRLLDCSVLPGGLEIGVTFTGAALSMRGLVAAIDRQPR